ncbi:hypothetical protein KY338_03435 [Candidatus Woesearchaeota archaeon]|nr:hypothetical protein [Candidatus Woesearchaeota archaeon]MBW3005344.1 hypothetical protein [Candidatus Woesearchaeota archaeon]
MNKRIRFAAFVMIFLVLCMPVAFAQKLDVTRFSGKDEVEDVVRPEGDELYIVVSAEMRGDPSPEVARTRLLVRHGGDEEYFSECSRQDSFYTCTYVSDDLINYDSEDYVITLVDSENNELKSVKKILGVDRTAPEIIQYSVEPRMSRTGEMKISYLVEDYGTDVGDSAFCSGVKEIRVTAGDSLVKKIDYDSPKKCDIEEQKIDYKYSTTDKFVGLDVCVVAKDYLGQESDIACRSYDIDNSPPKIKSVGFSDNKGYALSHIKTGQKVVADMSVVIEGEDDVVLENVKADLSKIHPGAGVRAADDKVGDTFIWNNVEITSPSTCEVPVTAVDEIGNNASAVLKCSLPVDDTGPVVEGIYASSAGSNATPLIGVNGTIYVDLLEEGSGMDKRNAFLDLHNIGLGTLVQADECADQGSGVWRCEWKVVPDIGTGRHKIVLIDGTSDDLGNYVSAPVSAEILVDTTPPDINSIDITFIHENADYGPNAVYGDTIEFLFNVTDGVEGYVNLSMVGGNYSPATECTGRYCKFYTLIDVSGPLNATLHFDFFDLAGNKESYDYDFFIYGVLLNDTVTNYWDANVRCSPKMIDRHTAELYNHPLYCHIKLTPNNPEAETVYVSLGDLGECLGEGVGYVVDLEVINNNFGSKDPYAVFTLAATPFTINKLKFNCPLYVATRVGDFFSPVVEVENITAKVDFYNLPYGEAYDNIEERIQHSMEKAVEDWEWVGTIEDVMDTLRSLCNTKNTIYSLVSVFEAAIDLLTTLGIVVGLVKKNTGEKMIKQAQNLCNKGVSPIERYVTGKPKPNQKKSVLNLFNLFDLACKMANCQLSREDAKEYDSELVVGASYFFGEGWEDACTFYKDVVAGGYFFADYDKIMEGSEIGDTKSPVNVKESIIGSLMCTCIPGITYNLNKIRQIHCGYAYCLGKRVLEEGLPRSYCDNEKAYMTCNYVTGQIFEVFPFASVVDRYINMIQEAYANPISLVTILSSLICGGDKGTGGFYDYCMDRRSFEINGPNMILYVLCSLPKTAAKIGDAVASYQLSESEGFGTKPVSNNYCEMAEDLLE